MPQIGRSWRFDSDQIWYFHVSSDGFPGGSFLEWHVWMPWAFSGLSLLHVQQGKSPTGEYVQQGSGALWLGMMPKSKTGDCPTMTLVATPYSNTIVQNYSNPEKKSLSLKSWRSGWKQKCNQKPDTKNRGKRNGQPNHFKKLGTTLEAKDHRKTV